MNLYKQYLKELYPNVDFNIDQYDNHIVMEFGYCNSMATIYGHVTINEFTTWKRNYLINDILKKTS